MKKIEEIKQCGGIIKEGNSTYYFSNNILYIRDVNGNREYELNDKPWEIWFAENELWLTNNNGQQITCEKCKIVADLLDLQLEYNRIYDIYKGRYLRFYNRGKNPTNGLYDLKTKEILYQSDLFFGDFMIDNYIFQKGESLKCMDIELKKLIIDINLKELGLEGKILIKFIGIYNESLICFTFDYHLLQINLKTLDYKIWNEFEIDESNILNSKEKSQIQTKKFYTNLSATLIPAQKKVIGFQYEYLWELNLETGKISSLSLKEVFKNNNISGCWSGIAFKGDKVFFISDQSLQPNLNHKLIEFNINSHEVIDSWQLPKERLRRGFDIYGPKIIDNNLLIAKEQNWTFHIFEIN